MEFYTDWSFPSREEQYIEDITDKLNTFIGESINRGGRSEGQILVKTKHTTAGLNVLEFDEEKLRADYKDFSQDLVGEDPYGKWVTHRGYTGRTRLYLHNCMDNTRRHPDAIDRDRNAGRHLRTTLFSLPSVYWDYVDGQLDLGPYQKFVFMEFDGRDGSDGNPERIRTIQARLYPAGEIIRI